MEKLRKQPTLRDAFGKLTARHRQVGRSAVTTKGYQVLLDLYSPDWWGKPLGDIKRSNVMRRHERVTVLNGPAAANAWVRAISSTLSIAMLHWEEALPYNPALGRFKNPQPARYVEVTTGVVCSIREGIAAIPSPVRQASWWVAFLTGLRQGDVATMRWEHIDLSAATLFLPTPKGGPSRRFVLPLCTQLLDRLDALPRESAWVFPAASATGHVHSLREKHLPCPHTLRHVWSTVAERQGLDEWRRAILLNQRPKAGINAVYTHAKATDYRAEAQRVADALSAYEL